MTRKPRWQDRDPRFGEESERYERPVPSRELLLKSLAEAREPLAFDGLAERLGVHGEDRAALAKRLDAMVRDGQLIKNRAGQYCLIDRLSLVVGTVSGHRDGFGFLAPDGGGDDLFLPYREMRMLFPGDRVAARVAGRDERGRSEGAVVEVLERRTKQVAGRFSLEAGVGFVVPDNRRISQRVVVPREHAGPARHGDLAVIEIVEQPSRNRDPVGRVLRVLPEGGGAATAIDLAIASHGLSHEFPPESLAEARRFGREVDAAAAAGREDLRRLPLVTIDGEDARDFDDAVWAEETAQGFRLIVAIADVSHYVRPGTALDAEARERATSVYFPNRVLPMLPEELSNHLCSLMPQVDRLCMACDMQVNRAGTVSKSRFFPAVMRSAARLTYTQVAAALEGRDPAARPALAPVLPVVERLHRVYGALRKRRESRGALDFEAPEVKVLLDAQGEVTDIREYPRNDAHRLIEECMIAANVEAARFLKKHRLPALFRIHDRPDEERMEDLKRFLSMRGVHLDIAGELEPKRLQKALQSISKRPDAGVLENAIIRSLPQALYQPLNIGHFGLALAEYAHFTSPIRRYPDLLVHRGIRHAFAGGGPDDFVHSAREMETLGQECSMRERKADEAARSVVAWLKCEYMRPRVGEEFDGVVTGVAEFGAFVQLKGLQVDGLVHVTALPRDYFRFHERDRTLVGERTGLRVSIGDELRVRLVRVDSAERKIDFELVARTGAHFHPRRREGRTARRK
ncbi:MAG TPA: ribonuclease R [Steroidobacteraceae bacterium]|nr:ribonuclease R [Steroidobacteraceae bacterium]